MDLEKLKYPIGKFETPSNISEEMLNTWISILEHFPARISNLVKGLSEDQLNTPYRPDGWTIKQVVHHVYDSHHNSYTRFKWTLTENKPLIKAYYQGEWAKIFDYNMAPIEMSLTALTAIHAKLVFLLKGMKLTDFEKEFVHPEGNNTMSLGQLTAMYAWHSNHHYAHIENLLISKGWK